LRGKTTFADEVEISMEANPTVCKYLKTNLDPNLCSHSRQKNSKSLEKLGLNGYHWAFKYFII